MPRKHPLTEFVESIREGRERHTLIFSGWLRYVKNIPEEDISIDMDTSELQREYENWLEEFSEYEFEQLKKIFSIVYPIQQRRLVVHFKWVKRELMKIFGLNRYEFDEFLLNLMERTHNGGVSAFYLSMCGSRPGSRLNYVSRANRSRRAVFMNSYCYIQFDKRNKYTKQLVLGDV